MRPTDGSGAIEAAVDRHVELELRFVEALSTRERDRLFRSLRRLVLATEGEPS